MLVKCGDMMVWWWCWCCVVIWWCGDDVGVVMMLVLCGDCLLGDGAAGRWWWVLSVAADSREWRQAPPCSQQSFSLLLFLGVAVLHLKVGNRSQGHSAVTANCHKKLKKWLCNFVSHYIKYIGYCNFLNFPLIFSKFPLYKVDNFFL